MIVPDMTAVEPESSMSSVILVEALSVDGL